MKEGPLHSVRNRCEVLQTIYHDMIDNLEHYFYHLFICWNSDFILMFLFV